jgi:hypothetical protein
MTSAFDVVSILENNNIASAILLGCLIIIQKLYALKLRILFVWLIRNVNQRMHISLEKLTFLDSLPLCFLGFPLFGGIVVCCFLITTTNHSLYANFFLLS